MKTVNPKSVAKYMKNLLEWYNSLKVVSIMEIIEFHARFEKIHLFQDGNGRVGRIIIFKECKGELYKLSFIVYLHNMWYNRC